MPKIEKKFTVINSQGLHARPAALFVQIAAKYESSITIRKGNESVNGKSIMGILMFGIENKTDIIVTAEGDDAQEVITELEEFLKQNE